MSAEPAFVHSWAVGAFKATLSAPRPRPGQQLAAVIEWTPAEPAHLTADEWAQYRAGRHHALVGIAAEFGINVAVLEL